MNDSIDSKMPSWPYHNLFYNLLCIHLSTLFSQHKHKCNVLIHFSEIPMLISLLPSYSLIVLSRYRFQYAWMMDQLGYLQDTVVSIIMLVVPTRGEFDFILMWVVKKSWLSLYGCRSNVLLSISRLVVGNEVWYSIQKSSPSENLSDCHGVM